jgi:rRNA processing protein Gar1
MKLKLTVLSILMALLSFSCGRKEEEPQQQAQPQQPAQPQQQAYANVNMRTGVVQEVLQATSYTYLKVKEGDRDVWIAVAKRDTEVGETVYFSVSLEKKDFESKDLKRKFESIYFVDRVTSGESRGAGAAPGSVEAPHRMKPVLKKRDISIDPAEGGITIGELLADADSYTGKTVRIKGQVTKVNRAILGKNWVHLQDGTDASGKFDLTITTQEQVNVGDVVTFEGTIALNKDFGAGYAYEVIMEEAKLL